MLRSGLVGGIALPIPPPLRRVMQINFRAAGLVFPLSPGGREPALSLSKGQGEGEAGRAATAFASEQAQAVGGRWRVLDGRMG